MIENNNNPLEIRDIGQDVMASGTVKEKTFPKKREYKQTFVRIGVWTCLIVLTGASVYTASQLPFIMASAHPAQVKMDKPQFQIENTVGAANFARNFSFYWLSNDLKTAQQFAADGFNLPSDSFQMIQKQTVKSVEVWSVSQKSENQVNVVVKAMVQGDKDLTPVFLSVPIVMDTGGKYGVYSLPTILPNPGKPPVPKNTPTGSFVASDTENKIKFIIESFFRFYSQGQSKDLSLLFDDEKPRKTLNGKYINLNETELYGLDDNKVLAKVSAWIEVNHFKVLQNYEFILIKNENGWRIQSTNPVIPTDN